MIAWLIGRCKRKSKPDAFMERWEICSIELHKAYPRPYRVSIVKDNIRADGFGTSAQEACADAENLWRVAKAAMAERLHPLKGCHIQPQTSRSEIDG